MSYFKRLYSCIDGTWWSYQLNSKKEMSLGSILEKQAARLREKPVIFFEDRIISYTLFNQTANRYSHFFQKRGFIKGDTVAILMTNRPEYLIIHAGLAKIGVVPSLVDPGLSGKELSHTVNIIEPRALIIGHECLNGYLKLKNEIKLKKPGSILVETEGGGKKIPPGMEDLKPLISMEPVSNPSTLPPVNSKDVLEYIYTSGVTGLPRAVEVRQQRWLQLGYTTGGRVLRSVSEDILYVCLPLHMNMAINVAWPVTLLHGGAIALTRGFSPDRFLDDIKKFNVSHWLYTGEMCRRLNSMPCDDSDSRNPLRYMFGAGLRSGMWSNFKKRFGIEKIVEMYMLSEGQGMLVNTRGIAGMTGRLAGTKGRPGIIVRYNMDRNEIVRGDDGLAVKCRTGESGLYLASVDRNGPFTGYKYDKSSTVLNMITDVMKKGDSYLVSGDIFRLHKGGYVSFSDRLPDIFSGGGELISPGGVTDTISRFGDFTDICIYGVSVKNRHGYVPMAALSIFGSRKPDLNGFASFISENLPVNQRPYFIRIRKEKDSAPCFNKQKSLLQKQGFNPGVVKDQLYFLEPETLKYIKITGKVFDDIQRGSHKF